MRISESDMGELSRDCVRRAQGAAKYCVAGNKHLLEGNAVIDSAIEVLTHPDKYDDCQELAAKTIITYAKNNTGWITKIWWAITGRDRKFLLLENILGHVGWYSYNSDFTYHNRVVAFMKSPTKANINIVNADQAYMRFMLDFSTIFGVEPKKMSEPEKKLMAAISERIWSSQNVQKKGDPTAKYKEYRQLMTSYYKGAHFNFELGNGESFLNDLKNKVGYVDDKSNLGKEQLAARVSSHFVRAIGEVDHVHLAGEQIPETVCGEVELPLKKDGIHGILIPGIRYDMYVEKYRIRRSNVEEIKPKKFFWIQTENNPDGPDWTSYLKHRTIDFVNYTCRKFFKCKDANVGPFGYGPGDKTPIVIGMMK